MSRVVKTYIYFCTEKLIIGGKNMNDRHFADFHIAGFTYYNGVDVFENLKIGKSLSLKAEPQNRFDPHAVAISVEKTNHHHPLSR